MIADVDYLWQEIDQVWDAARQSRAYTRMARARTILTLQEIQRAYRRVLTARMAPWMPTADAWTREITALILAHHGLLDETPAMRPPTDGMSPAIRQAGERQAAMTTDEFRDHGMALINQLLAQGFARPITFTAIASDGLTTAGSSETVTGTVLSGEKTTAPPDAFARYLRPIHLLFVDAQGRVAYGVISDSGTASVRILP
jgi:hypothetical protein